MPMYLIPFELFGRAIGVSPFPDRIAMGVMLAAFFFYCGTLLTALPGRGFTTVQAVGIMVLIAFSPPLLNLLLNGPQNVYEDASVYALLTSLAIFIAMLRFIARRRMSDYWICCVLGGMSGLVRPTHAIYGLLGPTVCCVFLLRDHRVRAAIIPFLLVASGIAFLAISNRIRFGAFTEFGHQETLTTPDGEMTSRFVNPILAEPLWVRTRELLGALFLTDIPYFSHGGGGHFLGQADCFRWRSFYVTSYDPSVLLLIILGSFVPLGAWLRANHRRPRASAPLVPGWLPIYLIGWGWTSGIVIFAFLAGYPGLCTRYFYDLWPAFLGMIISLWHCTPNTYGRISAVVLCIWLTFQLCRMECRFAPLSHTKFVDAHRARFDDVDDRALATLGYYDPDHVPPGRLTQLCDLNDRSAGFQIRLPIDRPRFIELLVSPRGGGAAHASRDDVYHARIGPCRLPLISASEDSLHLWVTVRFAVPKLISQAERNELLFVCFVSVGDDTDQASTRRIKLVRWR